MYLSCYLSTTDSIQKITSHELHQQQFSAFPKSKAYLHFSSHRLHLHVLFLKSSIKASPNSYHDFFLLNQNGFLKSELNTFHRNQNRMSVFFDT